MKPLFLSTLILLTGCGTIDGYRDWAAQRAANAADQSLETAKWASCPGASIGAVYRDSGADKEAYMAYMQACWEAMNDTD